MVLVACKGLNVWDHEWKGVPWPRLELPLPSYPWQRHSMSVYEITAGGKCVRFAAGELSGLRPCRPHPSHRHPVSRGCGSARWFGRSCSDARPSGRFILKTRNAAVNECSSRKHSFQFLTQISTRRFLSRPSSVLLGATGRSETPSVGRREVQRER